MLEIFILKLDEDPSSGITTVGEDMRDAVDRREPSVWVEDFWEIRDAVEVLVETLPGILTSC